MLIIILTLKCDGAFTNGAEMIAHGLSDRAGDRPPVGHLIHPIRLLCNHKYSNEIFAIVIVTTPMVSFVNLR